MENKPYFVTGLARCGHHAIIAWLCKQHDETILFHNNVNGDLKHKRTTKYGEKDDPDRHLYSLENFDLRGFQDLFSDQEMEQFILVVRDPFNWVASSLKKGGNLKRLSETWQSTAMEYEKWFCASMSRLDMYKQQMKQIIGKIDLIGRDYQVIKYNDWFCDRDYRREITNRLEIPFTDSGLNHVPNYGNGSSFDERNKHGEAQKMDVLNRWRHYEDSDVFWEFVDDEMIEYSEKVFNFNPLA